MARTIVKGPLAFTAADTTGLETYDASFVEVSALGAGFITIQGNKLTHRYGAGSAFIYRDGTPTYSADHYASAVLSFAGTLNVVRYGVAVRVSADTGAGQDWYAVTVDDVTSPRTTRVYKCVNGTVTTLDSRTSVTWTNGDTVELEAITNGGACDLKVYKNGSLLYTISDASSPLTSGKPGFYLYDTGGGSATFDNAEFGDVTASAPFLTGPTGAATGPTQATIGVTSDTAPTTTAISYQILPAATADPSAPTIVGAPTGAISTGSAGALTAAIAGLTTNTAVKVHFAQGTTSNVQSSAAFTPNTLAISGTALSAQTGTAGAAFTWTGATPESLITNTGNGSGSWTATAGVGASGVTVNSSTGILVAGSLGTAGSYTITLQRADGSTVPGAQTVTKTVGLTIAASGAATTITMSGPSSGLVSAASTNFTVGADGTITGTVIVTPSDGGGGGTFTPTTVSISSGTPTGTFTYTPATSGVKTISVTNNGGLANPSNISYTVSAGTRTVTLSLTTDGANPSANLTGLRWAFFDQALPNLLTTPTATGTNGTTNSSGVITVNVTGTALSAGATGYLIVSDTNGSVSQSPSCKAFSAPVLVA